MTKNIFIPIVFLLVPYLISAQFTGGIGRGDHAIGITNINLNGGPPCSNPADGGTIGNEQTICFNTSPDPLMEVSSPGGSPVGILQFQWQVSGDGISFTDITENGTSQGFSPPELSSSTWYKRLVKVDCETNWLESNVIQITVEDTQPPSFGPTLPPAPALALANVTEAADYKLIYQLDIPLNSDFNASPVPYTVDNSSVTGVSYDRVAYFLDLGTTWVWVSMDQFNTTLTQLGIPNVTHNNVAWQQIVTNMNVTGSAGSNVTNVTGVNGNIEMWHNCYYQVAGLGGIPPGNNSLYDFNDNYSPANPACYGSFQVHNHNLAQTIFAYNSWDNPGYGGDDLGIGNNTALNPDWTYAYNTAGYSVRKLYILVNAQGECPDDITLNAEPGICGATVTYNTPEAFDNCPGLDITQTTGLPSGSVFPAGTTTNTFVATDGGGNNATCSFDVTVIDNQAPVLASPGNQSFFVDEGNCSGDYSIADPLTDNCTNATWGYSLSGATTGSVSGIADGSGSGPIAFGVGTTTVTLSGTDGVNSATPVSFTVEITDNEPPVITCPGSQDVPADCITNLYTVTGSEFDPVSVTDNCGTVTSITNDYNNSNTLLGATFGLGTTTVTWTAMDDATPPNSSSCSFDVTVYQYTISGTLKYNNAAKTPMNNVELTISPAGTNATSTTDGSGNYSFTGLCPGEHTITVTNINKPVGYINSTDASMVNAWNANQIPIEHVKWMAGDVNQSYMAQSTDAKAIQNWFVYYGNPLYAFDRGEWAFFLAGEPVVSNADPNRLNDEMIVTVDGFEMVDIYGQAVGDFNGSFTPGGLKAASSTLGLVYGETRLAGTMAEVELSVRMVNPEEIGAVSLILDYPAELFEVTDVNLKLENGNLDWYAKGGELRIGWNSLTPLWLEANSLWLTIHGRTADSFGLGDEIRVTLAPDPLNELADGSNNVIPNAQLEIDVLAFSTTGTNNNVAIEQFNTLSLHAIPNPFAGYSKLEYRLPIDGHVTLEITDMLGRRVALLVDELQTAGEYSMKLDATPLQPGVYMATLRLETSDGDIVKTIKLVRER